MMNIKFFKSILLIISLFLITSCSKNNSMKPEDFKNKEPRLIIEEYLSGEVKAWGVLQNRSGKVIRQFSADLNGKWDGKQLILDEKFNWDDGEIQTRQWQINKIDDNNSLLILDDDQPFLKRLSVAMEKRGFKVFPASSMAEFSRIIESDCPNYAIIDLRLSDGTGLDAVESIRNVNPKSKIVVLTGYGAIATAVAAVKIGAIDYLSKPADANDILNALVFSDQSKPPPPVNPMSADRVKWEHIQRIFELCNRNVSETARRLNMHRRTLQRILAKRSPR